MMTVAGLLFLLGCITIIYPIRAIGLSRRLHGIFMIIGAIATSVAASPQVQNASSSTSETTILEAVVTRDQYGANWPWPKFERGIIRCKDDQVTIAMGSGPVIYGLNGRALSRGRYPDPGQFSKRDPGTEDISYDGRGISHSGGLRVTSELIQLGLRLCAQQGSFHAAAIDG